ncbi:MAG: hypothetical protein AAFQ04_10590 [Pseudomonadota bacterium]
MLRPKPLHARWVMLGQWSDFTSGAAGNSYVAENKGENSKSRKWKLFRSIPATRFERNRDQLLPPSVENMRKTRDIA